MSNPDTLFVPALVIAGATMLAVSRLAFPSFGSSSFAFSSLGLSTFKISTARQRS